MSKRWLGDLLDVKSSVRRKDIARMLGLFDVLERLLAKDRETIDRMRLTYVWLDETQPGWEQEFERWHDSNDRA